MELDDKELEKLKELVPYKILSPTPQEIIAEIERLNNIIEKLEQENTVLKTQVVNKDKYSYGIRVGSDKE